MNALTSKRVAIAFLSIAALALGGTGQQLITLTALSPVQELCAPLDAADAWRLAEVQRLIARHSGQVWPGWDAPAPLLVRRGECEYLIGHPAPPADFTQLEGMRIGGRPLFVLEGHLTPAPVATSWPVAGVWSVAIPALADFQAAIDQALGPGVVTLDDASYLRAAVHEAFHAYQLTLVGGPQGVPRFGLQQSESEALAALLALPDLDEHHNALGRTLARALDAPTAAETSAAVGEFMQLRSAWRETLPADIAAFEKATEWLEGVARYADTRLMILAAGGRDADIIWQEFMAQLQNPADIPGTLRDRYYVFGAAQAFLLDRLLPGWQERVLPGEASLEELLEEVVTASLTVPVPLRAHEKVSGAHPER